MHTSSTESIREQFLGQVSPDDVADLLKTDLKQLHYYLYILGEGKRYRRFEVPKRTGGARIISAPNSALKLVQRKLADVLLHVYKCKPSVHGFVNGRGVKSNAEQHRKRWNILTVDIKDFFPSINFGRVRGMFMGKPYHIGDRAATILAQICCYENQLPQGAPSSPIVSNMIAAKMDSDMQRLARDHLCFYTRYADDLTFSTHIRKFPISLAQVGAEGKAVVGPALKGVIADNGFAVNTEKVWLKTKTERQKVTGLVVNEFPNVTRKYVRQVRAMLHALHAYGPEDAATEYCERYEHRSRHETKRPISFISVLRGKIAYIGMIRGTHNQIYQKFLRQLHDLVPGEVRESLLLPVTAGVAQAMIFTEGKTDWMHLKATLSRLQKQGKYKNLNVKFDEITHHMGDRKLLDQCKLYSKRPGQIPDIFIFDRDVSNTVSEVGGKDGVYKFWGNSCFSFAIPVPVHRQDTPAICIEGYYSDEEIKTLDINDRRLYLASEFSKDTGQLLADAGIVCRNPKALGRPFNIIDRNVSDGKVVNIALTKTDFARNVINRIADFDKFDVSAFEGIFDVVDKIVQSEAGMSPPFSTGGDLRIDGNPD